MLIHHHRRNLFVVYGVAVTAVLAVAALRWLLDPVLGDLAPLILFLLPVAFSARFGGFGPGCVATVLSVVLGLTLFGTPGRHGPVPQPSATHTVIRGTPFVLVGTIISAFAAGLEAARLQAEEQKKQARDSEEFVRRVLASSPDCVKTLDLQGNLLSMTEAGMRLIEVTDLTPLLHTSWIDWWANAKPLAAKAVADALASGQGEFVAHQPTFAGTPKWWEVAVTPILGRDRKPERLLAVARDITQRRSVDAAMRRNEELQRLIFNSVRDFSIFTTDLHGKITSWSLGAARIFGYCDAEAIGMDCAQIFTPEDRAAGAPQRELDRALSDGRGMDDRWHLRKDGTRFFASGIVTPLRDETEAPIGFTKVARDVTEQQQAKLALIEARRRSEAALIAAEMGTFEWDRASNRLFGDTNFSRIFAVPLDGAGTAVIADCVANIHPDDRDRVLASIRASLGSGEDHETEFRVVTNSRQRWVLSRGRVTMNTAGEAVRFPGVVIDVTDRKLIEQERERLLASEQSLRQTAEQASRMKDDFLATISHELRTPLNAIVGWSTLIDSATVDSELLAEGIEAISRNASAQSQLIEDILDVARITSGKVRLNARQVDLREPIDAAIATVSNSARAKQIALVKQFGDAPALVLGDPDRLQQVFWNLLANAIKFTDQGSIRVCIEQQPGRVGVAVTDTGRGMDADFLPYVFDRFRQADMSTTRRHGGLGLGLAIVRQLVELHGGTVSADSGGQGTGSTFRVELPLASDVSPPREVEPASPARRSLEVDCPPVLEHARVLVIDDDPDGRRIVQAMLRQCGTEVTAVGNVGDAIGILTADHGFDAVLSDIGMPGDDGYAFLRRLRALEAARFEQRVPVAAITAFTRPSDRADALEAGFDHFLAKPITPALLIATVAQMVEGARSAK